MATTVRTALVTGIGVGQQAQGLVPESVSIAWVESGGTAELPDLVERAFDTIAGAR